MNDKTFLECARVIAKESHCISEKVACLIVIDDRIVSIGYNGTPSGYINCEDVHSKRGSEHTKWSNKYEIHAEMNALLYAAKNGISVNGATLYSTLQPCWRCSKNLVQAGIKRIVYSENYRRLKNQNLELENFLNENDVKVDQIKS